MCAMQGPKRFDSPDVTLHSEFTVFDRNPDPALDELVELTAILCGADYAYIAWADYNRLWFKSRFGFRGIEQTRTTTGCHWTLEKGASLLINNAGEDSDFYLREFH